MTKIVFKLILLFIASGLAATPLSDLSKPKILVVGESRFFVAEEAELFIYSLKSRELIKRVGKKGQGPGDFNYISSILCFNDKLMVISKNKVSYFTQDGQYLGEVNGVRGEGYLPLNGFYMGWELKRDNVASYICVALYDGEFKFIKEVSRRRGNFLGSRQLDPILIFRPLGPEFLLHKNTIITKDDHGGLRIVDLNGRTLHNISLSLEKIPVTNNDISEILRFYETNPVTRNQYPELRERFRFPSHFPLVRDFHLDDGKIYIQTFNRNADFHEFVVFTETDIEGNKVFIKLDESGYLDVYPYYIKNNQLYQLVETDESWQLRISTIPASES